MILRRWALLGALAVGLVAGLAVTQFDSLENTLREVTLPLRHDDIIRQQAAEKGVDPALIAAVIYAESRFRPRTSTAGARGLMQITPRTARHVEKLSGGETFVVEDLANPDINIRYGTFYLRHLLDRYRGNQVAALAAYNAGQSQVDEWGGADLELEAISFPETRAYVEKVRDKHEDYRSAYAEELAREG